MAGPGSACCSLPKQPKQRSPGNRRSMTSGGSRRRRDPAPRSWQPTTPPLVLPHEQIVWPPTLRPHPAHLTQGLGRAARDVKPIYTAPTPSPFVPRSTTGRARDTVRSCAFWEKTWQEFYLWTPQPYNRTEQTAAETISAGPTKNGPTNNPSAPWLRQHQQHACHE